jgi:hypothetical protein
MNGTVLLVGLLCGLLGMAIAAAGMARERLRETRLRLAVYREHCAALTADAGGLYDRLDAARDREAEAVDKLVAVLEENRARGYCPGCMGGFDGETMPSAQMSCAEGCAVWEVCRFITGRVPGFYIAQAEPAEEKGGPA